MSKTKINCPDCGYVVGYVVDYKKGKIWDINYKEIQMAIDSARAALAKAKGDK